MAEIELPESGIIHTWVEFLDSGNNRNVWAMDALVDPGAYYGGFKEPRVIEFGALVRALSDINGTYQGADFALVLSDTDRVIRKKLANASTKFFLNRSLVVRMIDDISRRAGLEPRTVMRGLVADYRPLPDLEFRMSAQDLLTRRFSSPNAEIGQVPKRVIRSDDFPNCPPDLLGAPVPIIYGTCSDRNERTVTIGSQPKFTSTGNVKYQNIGSPGTWQVYYVITLVGDETADPPWAGKNQQDERILGQITINDAIGPDEYVPGARYTQVEWDVPSWYGSKIYGRFAKTASRTFRGSTFGYLNYVPPPGSALPSGYVDLGVHDGVPVAIPQATYSNWLANNPGDEGRAASAWYNDSENFYYDQYIAGGGGDTSHVVWIEGWFSPSQDQYQPPTNNQAIGGTYWDPSQHTQDEIQARLAAYRAARAAAGLETDSTDANVLVDPNFLYWNGSAFTSSGTTTVSTEILVDNGRGVIRPIYVGPKRFR